MGKRRVWASEGHRHSGALLAIGAAALFGASTPIAKLLLGFTDPLLLAGLLYLGSGVGLAVVSVIGSVRVRRLELCAKVGDGATGSRRRIVGVSEPPLLR
jgi:hypothetical protein